MTFLELVPRFVLGDLDLTEYPFAVNQEGLDFQTGDLVTSVLSSFLLDGDIEVSQRRGNMTLAVPILIEGADLAVLAVALKALALEAEESTNTFAIDPGDGFGEVTIFDTFRGTIDYTYNAAAEQNGYRQYTLTMRALPHGRSDFEVVAEAVVVTPTPPTVTVINDCSSAAGWSSSSGTVSAAGGAVVTTGALGTRRLRLAQSFSVAGARWVAVDWMSMPSSLNKRPYLLFNDGAQASGYRVESLPGGFTRTYFQVPAATPDAITSLDIVLPSATSFSVDRVATTTSLPSLGTNRQQSRTVPVAGSARTQGGVRIYSPTSSLGEVLVHTSSTGIAPPLGAFRTAGGVTADTARVTGGYSTLSSANVFDFPAGLLTSGLYSLVALVSAPASDLRTISWSTTGRMGGVAVGRTYAGSATTSSSDYRFVALGNVTLPTNGMRDNTSGVQRFTVQDMGSGSAARLDELYLCNLTTGRLTIVSCGTGTPAAGGPSSRLWLDAASIVSRTSTVMRGMAADGSDAFFPGVDILPPGLHEFAPPAASIFTVTTNATDAQVTLAHYPRWLGHAASVEL